MLIIIWSVVDRQPLWKMMEWKSVGMMTFPIYGKRRNVPIHQPANVSKDWSPPQSPQFILMKEVFVFSSIGFHTGHKACHPLKKCCETAEPTPRNLRLVWQKKPEQSSRSLSNNTTFHSPSGLKCLKSESVKWNLATHLGSITCCIMFPHFRFSSMKDFIKSVSVATPSKGRPLYNEARQPPTERCPAKV